MSASQVWLVTGATGGLGAAIAAEVASRGDYVVATGRRQDRLTNFAEAWGEHALVIPGDITDSDHCRHIIESTKNRFGRLDVLVNNAGNVTPGALEELDEESFREQFETNVFAVHALTRCALPVMRTQGTGSIVMISSEAGVTAQGGFAAYGASKGALEGMSAALRLEVAPMGIRVMVVEPGPMKTAFGRGSLDRSRPDLGYPSTLEWMRRYPGEVTSPADAARAIVAITKREDLPERLAIGPDSHARIRRSVVAQLAELDRWERVSTSVEAKSLEPTPLQRPTNEGSEAVQDDFSILDRWIEAEDPYDYDPQDVLADQLRLTSERFRQLRGKIDALDHIAKMEGVDGIDDLSNLLPVLFSHESYKSYPEALVSSGRWTFLSTWLARFTSVEGIADVNMAQVSTIDEWMGRLRENGYHVFGSSGTSGKSSLFALSNEDRDVAQGMHEKDFGWGLGLGADNQVPASFLLMPRRGFYRGSDDISNVVEVLTTDPANIFWLSHKPMLLSEMNKMGAIRAALARGTAKASEVASAGSSPESDDSVRRDLDTLIEELEARRDRPVFIWGGWPQQYRVTKMLRERGAASSFLHPDSVIHIAGGNKGASLPDDFESQVRDFWGLDNSRYLRRYGCSEIVVMHPACSEDRYHIGPWVMPFVLDKAGTKILNQPNGSATGRAAFMDLTSTGRWGGVITGDRVTLHSGRCPCGRSGMTVTEIARYMDLDEGEDKLSCAGTIEAYVRGEIVL